MSMFQRIFVTGMGICSPIGCSVNEVVEALEQSRSGISEIESFDCQSLTMRHAGEVKTIPHPERYPAELYQAWDRGTRMAMHAAGEALRDACVDVNAISPERFGLCIGTSGSGQYQNPRFDLERRLRFDAEAVFYISRNAPHYQSAQVAAYYGIRGPSLAIGAATAGSGIALAVALSWLRTDRVDLVLVGGSESFSLLNVLGFDQLGLTIPEPCTPFSGRPGMTFGEGAGYLVLETETSAERRNARCRAELQSVAVRADGFDPILFDPSGDGQARAMTAAMVEAHCEPDDIDWIRASGTGGRDQDLAETQAIKSAFPNPPPVSSLEPFFGHANGAGPAIGLVAAIACIERGIIPPTLTSNALRPGCDLDYVTEGVRHQPLNKVLCNTAAFGGVNTAIVVSKVERTACYTCSVTAKPPLPIKYEGLDDIVITGLGMISARGCGKHELADCFNVNRFALSKDPRMAGTDLKDLEIGLVQGFSAREICPSIKLRGVELLTQYAAGAVSLALKDARLDKTNLKPERVGVVAGITRSSGTVFEKLFDEIGQNGFRPMVGRLMLRNGRFMVASQIANWYDLRGYTSTISLGIGCGLHSLISAYDQLRQDPSLDAIVVLACDEVSPFNLRLLQKSKVLSWHHDQWQLYAPNRRDLVPGEGAVAVVLERKRFATRRGSQILAEIAGTGMTSDAAAGGSIESVSSDPLWQGGDSEGIMFTQALARACTVADLPAEAIDLVMTNGSGVWQWDQKEFNGLNRFFKAAPQVACVNGHLGFCEASSALFNLAAAISALKSGRRPLSPRSALRISSEQLSTAIPLDSSNQFHQSETIDDGELNHALVTASTEHGQHAALILKRSES